MSDKDSKLLWEAYNEGVEANTPPRDKKNRGDFLPKHVQDKINKDHGDDEDKDEEEEGLEEDAREDMLKVMQGRTSGEEAPQAPQAEELNWRDVPVQQYMSDLNNKLEAVKRMTEYLPDHAKDNEDWKQLVGEFMDHIDAYLQEIDIKMHDYA